MANSKTKVAHIGFKPKTIPSLSFYEKFKLTILISVVGRYSSLMPLVNNDKLIEIRKIR
jgi:hypothetical protein